MTRPAPARGEPGYTPSELDFCSCGATFQLPETPEGQAPAKVRICPQCGAEEGKRRSFHERTGRPYQNLLLPSHRRADA